MADINEVKIRGRVISELELASANGTQVLNFVVVTNRIYKKKNGEKVDEVTFHPMVAWGIMADVISESFSKGDTIMLYGRLREDKWVDKEGNKRNKMKVVVEGIEQ